MRIERRYHARNILVRQHGKYRISMRTRRQTGQILCQCTSRMGIVRHIQYQRRLAGNKLETTRELNFAQSAPHRFHTDRQTVLEHIQRRQGRAGIPQLVRPAQGGIGQRASRSRLAAKIPLSLVCCKAEFAAYAPQLRTYLLRMAAYRLWHVLMTEAFKEYAGKVPEKIFNAIKAELSQTVEAEFKKGAGTLVQPRLEKFARDNDRGALEQARGTYKAKIQSIVSRVAPELLREYAPNVVAIDAAAKAKVAAAAGKAAAPVGLGGVSGSNDLKQRPNETRDQFVHRVVNRQV